MARPPDRAGAFGRAVGSMAAAAAGGLVGIFALLVTGQVLGFALSLVIQATDLQTWARVGLLVSLSAVRAEAVATFQPAAGLPVALPTGPVEMRVVPMALTIGFLWLAAGAGRRAARAWPGASPLARAALAAAGAGVPVAAVAALAATLVTLSFPDLRLTVEVDAASAALWSGVLAAAAAATGAYLESAAGQTSAAVIRGGVASSLWALGLLALGVVVLATLEPGVTRSYVDGLRGLGPVGAAWFGAHLLALPAQSALLLVPAAGSCLDLLTSGATAVRLCPWELRAISPLAEAALSPDPTSLSPSCWLLLAVPPIAAFLGGRRAGAGQTALPGLRRGALAGVVFAALGLVGAMFAAPRIVAPTLLGWLRLTLDPLWLRTAGMLFLWGVVGGAIGGRFPGRRPYEEPELPRPTSA
jgi:hypothetical protein